MALIGLRAALSALALASAFATGAQAVVLGGAGAPQSQACAAAGGTEDGSYCVLPNGDYCESMTLFRENVCKGPDGTVQSDDDYGSNEVVDDSSGSDDGGAEDE